MVRRLCRHFGQDGVVYLTARDEGRGLAAVELLRKEGLSPKFHLLDVTDKRSIDKSRDHLEETYGGIDILINNAGIGSQCVSVHVVPSLVHMNDLLCFEVFQPGY